MTDYCFGFTGTHRGMTLLQMTSVHRYLENSSGDFHHGDCIGSDKNAHVIAAACGYRIILHPPTNSSKRAWCKGASLIKPVKPYLERDRDIVDETTALIATPFESKEQPRGGTWYTVRYARSIGKTVVLILPDGTIHQK